MHQLLARDGANIAKINIFSHKRKKSNIFLQAILKNTTFCFTISRQYNFTFHKINECQT